MIFTSQERKMNFGMLFMRLGLAAVLLIHALPKLFDGTAAWKKFWMSLEFESIGLPGVIMGFAILMIESIGALSLLCGYFFRVACALLSFLYGLYFFGYLYYKSGYVTLTLWSLGLAVVFFGLIYVGPGRYAVSVKLEKK
jgi:putative oxidoreductase